MTSQRGPKTANKEAGATTAAGVTIDLEIECCDDMVADALTQALKPDNRYFPKDQEFLSSRKGPVVGFKVNSPRLRPALATIGSIVSDAKLFGEVWAETSNRQKKKNSKRSLESHR